MKNNDEEMNVEEEEEEVTIKDVFKFMVDFKREVSGKLDEKIGSLEMKIETKLRDLEHEVIENQQKNKEMFDESNTRMRRLEEEMDRMRKPSKGIETLRRMEAEIMIEKSIEVKEIELERKKQEEERREHEKIQKKYEEEKKRRMRKEKETKEKATNLQDELKKATDKEGSGEYNWETQASDWLDLQVKKVNVKIRKEDQVRKKNRGGVKGGGMAKLRNWFGESESESTDESDPEEGEEWNKVERKEKNMRKKKKAEEKKKRKRKEVTEKAKMIVGIGPIKKINNRAFHRKRKKPRRS